MIFISKKFKVLFSLNSKIKVKIFFFNSIKVFCLSLPSFKALNLTLLCRKCYLLLSNCKEAGFNLEIDPSQNLRKVDGKGFFLPYITSWLSQKCKKQWIKRLHLRTYFFQILKGSKLPSPPHKMCTLLTGSPVTHFYIKVRWSSSKSKSRLPFKNSALQVNY